MLFFIDNRIGSGGAQTLAPPLANLVNLTSLNLSCEYLQVPTDVCSCHVVGMVITDEY